MVNNGSWNQTVKQAAAVYLPFWQIDLLRRQWKQQTRKQTHAEQAVLLTLQSGNVIAITHCCEHALLAGVRSGMKLSHARALLNSQEVHVEPFDPSHCNKALEKLAAWMMRYSPRVAIDDENTLLLDITGCTHLLGGTKPFMQCVHTDLANLGIRSKVAIAPTSTAARALAQFGSEHLCCVSEQNVRHALDPLPIQALHCDPEAAQALALVGIEKVGQLFDVPRKDLPARCGSELLLCLDQALGQAIEVVPSIQPKEQIAQSLSFEYPVTSLETIEHVTKQLLIALCEMLKQAELGARQLTAHYSRHETTPVFLSLPLSQPSRNTNHLWKLLHPKVERLNMGHGVEAITLTVLSTGNMPHRQDQWWNKNSIGNGDKQFFQLLDTLNNRLGVDRVLQMRPVESHLPEHASLFEKTVQNKKSRQCSLVGDLDRPSVLYVSPQLIRETNVTHDGSLSGFTYQQQQINILSSYGPERVLGTWWHLPEVSQAAIARDYFKVQDESGTWWWVFRNIMTSKWYVHGVWA